MTTSVSGEPTPKFPRGKNPNSLANLHTAWKKGESGNPAGNPSTGPMVTPALRQLATMPVSDLLRLDVNKMAVKDAIAYTYLVDCLQATGSRSRDAVTDRLDGALAKAADGNVDNRIQILVLEYDGIQPDRIG